MSPQTQDGLAGYRLPTLLRTCKVPLLWARYYCFLSASSIKSCCSVNKPSLIFCNPMNWSMPGFPVLHSSLEFAQVHIHWVNDNISSSVTPFSSCPRSFPKSDSSEPALHIRWQKYQSFCFSITPSNHSLISFRTDWFDLLAVQGILRVFSSTIVWKHQFFGSQSSLWSNSHICTRLLEKKNHSFIVLLTPWFQTSGL